MNLVILRGRLCRNPALTYTENQTAVCKFYLAVDKPYNPNRQEGDVTADFLPCIVFGKKAESIENYFQKGSKIAVQGYIATSTYMKDSEKRYSFSVIVNDFEFC